ncbi:MAG: biotin--[acetyl-CoA-carboxylase] ligase [Candidatus Acididesulfobacter guangdongensis]|uniref:biotin--[biotin carboxyl-carrier protein] ligase n=1 Tax=Acididesulfobacter guangdongensis TaxID=2597225 RepID=A0A519BGG4_ACIG2|nr:MAG: biotin--[acetyl-CoA-carboxylase] ligase [Candidatus Acididesulfobacter guangdongensis]
MNAINELDYIDIFEIKKHLKTNFIGKNIFYEEKVGSTNLMARELAVKGAKNGTVVIADTQDKGKGRNGKIWTSPKACNIYLSIILKPKFTPEAANGMTILAATAAAESIKEISSITPQIKWPNDILVNSKKVSGILTEMSTQNNIIEYIIIGIGINVNLKEEDIYEDIKNVATSLYIERTKELKQLNEDNLFINRNNLIISFLNKFEKYYETFLSTGLSSILQIYQKYFGMIGKDVEINSENHKIKGQVVGIDSKGALLLKTGENELEKVVSGELTVLL